MENKNWMKYLIIFIGVCVLFTCGYVVYSTYSSGKNLEQKEETNETVKTENSEQKEDNKTDVGVEIDANSTIVTTVMSNFEPFFNMAVGRTYQNYFHKGNSYTNDSLGSDVKTVLAIYPFMRDKTYTVSSDGKKALISGADVRSNVQKIFGKNSKYENTSLNGGYCTYADGTYIAQSDQYQMVIPNRCGGTGGYYIINKVEKATEYSDRLEIVEKSGVLELDGKLYNNINKQKLIASNLETTNMPQEYKDKIYQQYKDQFDSYTYVFKKDNGNYYFDSITYNG